VVDFSSTVIVIYRQQAVERYFFKKENIMSQERKQEFIRDMTLVLIDGILDLDIFTNEVAYLQKQAQHIKNMLEKNNATN
jgi:hypothetical protein